MTISYHIQGRTGPDAATVLLSPGLGGAAGFWRPQMAALTANFRVITYDHRGTGDNAEALQEGHSIADMAQDMADIIQASQSGACHVIGHALGGLIGLELTMKAPELVASLVLVNAWDAPNPHSARCFRARKQLLLSSGPRAYVDAQPIFLYPASWGALHADLVDAEIEHALQHFQGTENLLRRIDALLSFNIAQRLDASPLDKPVLVAASRDDVLVPWTCSQQLAARLPRAEFSLVEAGGHSFTVTEAERFNHGLLAFLARHAAAPA